MSLFLCIFRWLPKTAMSPRSGYHDSAHTDFILVIGVSRPKLAAVFISVMLISLFLTFHILYDSAVISLQVKKKAFLFILGWFLTFWLTFQTSTIPDNSRMAILSNSVPNSGSIVSQQQQQHKNPPDYSSSANVLHSQPFFSIFNHVPPPVSLTSISNNNNINSNTNNNNRVHFPKTSRRLPQVIEYLYFVSLCVVSVSIFDFFLSFSFFSWLWQTIHQWMISITFNYKTSTVKISLFSMYRQTFTHTHAHKQCLIIGVRKCGTRALLEMLYLHPRIQKAAGEVHFFDRDENYLKGLEWYRKKMPHSFRGQITIEKSPSYFVTPEVSRNMCFHCNCFGLN